MSLLAILLFQVVITWSRAVQRGNSVREQYVAHRQSQKVQPDITILIPAWNESATIQRCLDSLRRQTHKDWNAIIIAGGEDGTLRLASEKARIDERLQVIEQTAHGKNAAEGKLVGVIGSHEKRGEMELVIDTAKLMAGEPITFLIAGRGTQLAWAKLEARRLELMNIRFYGLVPFNELPSAMAALDVGLCPYQKTAMDDARSPMRPFSHLASGAPVVCTDLTSVRALSMENVVLVRDTPAEFADGIRHALSLPRKRPANIAEYDLSRLVAKYEKIIVG